MRFKAHRRPGHPGHKAALKRRRPGGRATTSGLSLAVKAAQTRLAATPRAAGAESASVEPQRLVGRWERNAAGRLVMVWSSQPVMPVSRPDWVTSSEIGARSSLTRS